MRLLATAALALVATVDTAAGAIVHFADGRSIRVERVEPAGALARLILDAGATIAVPTERIVAVEIEVAKPRVVEPATAQLAEPAVAEAPWRTTAGPYADLIARAAERHAVDPVLLTAMAEVESAFDPTAVSPKGARGLLQLMPQTAERFGVNDPFDVGQNVDGAARYLAWLLGRFDGRRDLALAGYNAGEAAVDRHRGIPPYRETRNYVDRVLDGAGRLSAAAP
jgi:soluble lytic murein transglycosylase-like protein